MNNEMASTAAALAIGTINEDPRQVTEGSVFELSLDASSDIAGLTVAIRSLSSSVEEVRVDIYNSFTSRWEEEGVRNLFQVLGDVPHLQKIEFYGLRIFPYVMPITMAERTLSRATTLQEFSLVGVNLTASSDPSEFQHFSTTLRQHPSLKVFGLDNCRLRDERTGPTLDEAIVAALVEIPSLEKVIIRAMETSMWGTLSCSSVASLCSSTTLKNLELFVFSNCGSSFLNEMARTLIEHKDVSQLEEVSISGCLGGVKGAQMISKMIRTNTKLKSLELHLRERSEEEDEAAIIDLSTALGKNKSLEKFQLHGATNKGGSVETRKAYLHMLQSNYSLVHGVQVFHPGFLRPHNELYLKLNQVGRGRLLGDVNNEKKEWVNTLVQVTDDIDCLYYLLHTNPLLCEVSSTMERARCETPGPEPTLGLEATRKRKRPEMSCVPGLVTP